MQLPDIDHQSHIHGITVGTRSGRTTAQSRAPSRLKHREPTCDSMSVPKTLTTRKGALQIYVAPEDMDYEDEDQGLELRPKYVPVSRPHGQELIDLSLRLGTMGRLALSVLQFGDQVKLECCALSYCLIMAGNEK